MMLICTYYYKIFVFCFFFFIRPQLADGLPVVAAVLCGGAELGRHPQIGGKPEINKIITRLFI